MSIDINLFFGRFITEFILMDTLFLVSYGIQSTRVRGIK